jgi:hypothetical protein
MGSREEQVNALRDFYAKHDSSKTAEQVVGIVDKRRGAQAAVSPAVWAQLCTQLERKYGERPAPPTTAATSSTSSTAPAPPLRASNTATAGAADTLIPTQRPVAGAAAAVAAAAETRGQESTANAATPAADEGTLAAASSEPELTGTVKSTAVRLYSNTRNSRTRTSTRTRTRTRTILSIVL